MDTNVDMKNTECSTCKTDSKMVEIVSQDPMSAAKVMALIYGLIGILYGLIYGCFFVLMGLAGAGSARSEGLGVFGVFAGLMFLVLSPIIFALMGFVSGAIGAFVYNFAVKYTGGLKYRIREC